MPKLNLDAAKLGELERAEPTLYAAYTKVPKLNLYAAKLGEAYEQLTLKELNQPSMLLE